MSSFKIRFKLKALSPMLFLAFATSLFSAEEAFDDQRFYPNPGIIALRDGRWVGSDHLYNLTNKIDIVIEFFTPPSVVLPVTKENIKTTVSEIFKKARITPPTDFSGDKPPLPFFHMLIMMYPIEKGYVVYCEGRLFEQVELDRVKPDEQTAMQAITWESQNLIITSKEDLANQLTKSVDEIATAFANRFRFYEDIRLEIQRNRN
ncbi:MAG TPA: hypothetical protein VIH61_08825 [Waddliaceae bacterium]